MFQTHEVLELGQAVILVALTDNERVRIVRVTGNNVCEIRNLSSECSHEMLHNAVCNLERLYGPDTWVVVGGTPRTRNELANLLPQNMKERTLVHWALCVHSTHAEIQSNALAAAQLMRHNRESELAALAFAN